VKTSGARPRARCCTTLFPLNDRVLMFGGDTYGEARMQRSSAWAAIRWYAIHPGVLACPACAADGSL
jgi:hypothetical protein